MIEKLIAAISIALGLEFGEGYTKYKEYVTQGIKEPCFFITCVNPSVKAFPNSRYRNHFMFHIQYLPKDTLHPNEECYSVGERLNSCLEVISESGDLLRGTQMHFEVEGGALNYFVSYDFFTNKIVDKADELNEISMNITAKE